MAPKRRASDALAGTLEDAGMLSEALAEAGSAAEKALGRGYEDELPEIDIDALEPDPDQPRQYFSREDLEDTANSILQLGLIDELKVRLRNPERPDEHRFIIEDGERRWRACREILWGERRLEEFRRVKCLIKRKPRSAAQILAGQVVTCDQKQDLKTLEYVKAYRVLREHLRGSGVLEGRDGEGLTAAAFAERFGLRPKRTQRLLRIMNAISAAETQTILEQYPDATLDSLTKLAEWLERHASRLTAETRHEAIERYARQQLKAGAVYGALGEMLGKGRPGRKPQARFRIKAAASTGFEAVVRVPARVLKADPTQLDRAEEKLMEALAQIRSLRGELQSA